MFLFSWLHYGESIIDFEKTTFFHREAIFHSVRESQGAKVAVFDVGNFFEEPLKNLKIVGKKIGMLYKVSVKFLYVV